MNTSDAAAAFHERTKHTWQRLRANSHGLDWGNQPFPFKLYPDLEPLPLPRELPESGMPATEVLSGHLSAPAAALDLAGLARLLFFSAGVTRILHGVLFRAAPSAGALYPTELYAVCGPLADLPAGVYHFEPAEFALRRLRDGVLVGFVDQEVSGLLGLGEPEEYPLGLVTVAAPAAAAATGSPTLEPISPRTRPLSRSSRSYPLGAGVQRAGDLPSAEAVSAWRRKASWLRAQPATRSLAAGEADQVRAASDTIEAVILRRGSTRRFVRHPIPRDVLGWAMAAASRAVPSDFVAPQATLLEHFPAVHAVQGLPPGAYHWSEGEFQLLRAGAARDRTRALCLGQDLGGDAATTVFHCAQLNPVLEALGARGYRAAQLEGGVAAERLQLAAFALGVGATGLTFLDDDVSAYFGTRSAPMLTVAVGVPAYRARPGKRPTQLPHIGVAER
jgi:Nitroreductase family